MTDPTRHRHFGLSLFRVASVLACTIVTVTAFADGVPREGIDFTIVKPTQPSSAPIGKTEVIEFFGYWCPRCFEFEPTMSDWARRNDAKVGMAYVPIAFTASQAGLQKMYYALDAMGKEKALRRKVFDAIHRDHSLSPTPDTGAMATWAEKNGLDKQAFIDTMNSFSVQTKVNRANQVAAAFGVTGVPTLAIGGKYLISVQPSTIGNADLFLNRVVGER